MTRPAQHPNFAIQVKPWNGSTAKSADRRSVRFAAASLSGGAFFAQAGKSCLSRGRKTGISPVLGSAGNLDWCFKSGTCGNRASGIRSDWVVMISPEDVSGLVAEHRFRTSSERRKLRHSIGPSSGNRELHLPARQGESELPIRWAIMFSASGRRPQKSLSLWCRFTGASEITTRRCESAGTSGSGSVREFSVVKEHVRRGIWQASRAQVNFATARESTNFMAAPYDSCVIAPGMPRNLRPRAVSRGSGQRVGGRLRSDPQRQNFRCSQNDEGLPAELWAQRFIAVPDDASKPSRAGVSNRYSRWWPVPTGAEILTLAGTRADC